MWVDDPHFNVAYHVRHTALPAPAGEQQLRKLAGRVFSQQLDRSKPLWEIWLVDHVGDDHFALVCKTHHALVDGISGVDIMTVLFDLEPDPPSASPGRPGTRGRSRAASTLLADAVTERLGAPVDAGRAALGAVSAPRRRAAESSRTLAGLASMAAAGSAAPRRAPLNTRIGPHRRFAWVERELGRFKAIKGALGGTVNDVVLTVVTGALRATCCGAAATPSGLELKAMVPVSIRAEAERGALGNQVAAMYAPLPVGLADPLERFRDVHEALGDLKASGQAVGAERLTQLAGFAAPTVLDQAARLQTRQRFFNLTVTNVPGPQFPLYMLGRKLSAFYPMVPLVLNTALGIAIMSYDGKIFFGLLGDYDAMEDLDESRTTCSRALDELATAACRPTAAAAGARPASRRTKSRA